MNFTETLAQREKRESLRKAPEPYRYDIFPIELKVQVMHLWLEAIGRPVPRQTPFHHPDAADLFWRELRGAFQRATGTIIGATDNAFSECLSFFERAAPADAFVFVEMVFQKLPAWQANHSGRQYLAMRQRGIMPHPGEQPASEEFQQLKSAQEVIEEMNFRFDHHGIGYQFVQGRFIRRESQFLHTEAVSPALRLLEEPGFEGANEEFAKAHDHLRHRRNKEAISSAGQAFESVMKVICAQRGYAVQPNATAKPLLDELFKQGLIRPEVQASIGTWRAAIEQGLPTLRNRIGSHGQGTAVVVVPDYLAAFALHMAAANILFLVEAHKDNPPLNSSATL